MLMQPHQGLPKCGQVAVLLACACPAEGRRQRGGASCYLTTFWQAYSSFINATKTVRYTKPGLGTDCPDTLYMVYFSHRHDYQLPPLKKALR